MAMEMPSPDDGVGSFEAGPYTNGAEGDGE